MSGTGRSPSLPDDNDDDDDGPAIKPVGTIRYLNIADTPCYRDTLLYSITGALSVGLIQFMMTSNVRRSTSTAIYTLSGGMIIYYAFCRHRLAREKFKFQQMQHNLADYVSQRGKLEEEEE